MARWKVRCRLYIRRNWTFFAISYGWDVMSGNRSKSSFFEGGWVTLSADFRGTGALPTNHCWYQSSRVIALSCGIKISAVRHLVLLQSTRVSDGRTDWRTDRITTPKTALTYARAVKTFKNAFVFIEKYFKPLKRCIKPCSERPTQLNATGSWAWTTCRRVRCCAMVHARPITQQVSESESCCKIWGLSIRGCYCPSCLRFTLPAYTCDFTRLFDEDQSISDPGRVCISSLRHWPSPSKRWPVSHTTHGPRLFQGHPKWSPVCIISVRSNIVTVALLDIFHIKKYDLDFWPLKVTQDQM